MKKTLPNEKISFGIIKAIDHPALDATVNGIKDYLIQQGYKADQIKVESVRGDNTLAANLAAKYINLKPKAIIAVGTLPLQAFKKYVTNPDHPPVFFSSVTSPEGVGIKYENNQVFGVSNAIEVRLQLDFIKNIQPNLKTLGVLYNPGEINSVVLLEKLRISAPNMHIILREQIITKPADIASATTQLAPTVDAIFINNDNTALSGMSLITNISNKFKIPVYVSDVDAIKLGAVAAVGPNQYELGQQTAKMVLKVLKKEPLSAIIEYPDKVIKVINLSASKKIALKISQEVIKNADQVINDQL
jgi:putative ABC transport system substrate-binding protein